MTNEVLVAVPLFIFMGVMLERSGIAEALLLTMGKLFGNLRGGLGISVILVGALLAASTGVVGATVVTMGLISLPAMLRAGYDPKLATGVICASGTLGPDHPALDRADLHGRHAVGHQRPGADGKGQFRPRAGLGRRPVRRRLHSRPAAGRALYRLDDLQGRSPIRNPARQRRCRRTRSSTCCAKCWSALVPPLAADHRRARLDPRRHRHPDRGRLGRLGRRHAAGRCCAAAQLHDAARRR